MIDQYVFNGWGLLATIISGLLLVIIAVLMVFAIMRLSNLNK